MANRYWVGGTANWDGTAGTKWALTSGGAGGQAVPTSADDVFFDGNSGAVTCTIAAGNTGAKSITCTGFTGTLAGSTAITVSGSVTLVAGMTVTYSGTLTLNATGTLTTAGKTIGPVTVSGSGITVTLGDALTSSGALTVTQGTFTTNNYNVTATQLSSNNSNTRTINLGSSTVTLTSSTINFTTNTGLTFNAGTSSIVCSGVNSTITGGSPSTVGVTFYNVSLTSTLGGTDSINGINVFNNLAVTGPASAGVRNTTFNSSQTINGTLSTTGTAGNRRVWFSGAVYGIAQTLTINSAPSLTDADFRDIYVVGTAAPISGTRIGNLRGCRGITFSTPKSVYWVTAAGGNWSANNWAASSGGAASTDNFPLAQDTAIIENTGLNTSAAVTMDSAIGYAGTVTMSTRTNAMTLNLGAAITIYGNWTNGSGTTIGGSNTITFSGRNTQTITSAGKAFPGNFVIDTYGGSVELADALTVSSAVITVTNGTFDTKNYNVTAGGLSSSNSNVRTITLGSSTLTLSGISAVDFTTNTNLTFNAATSTITSSGTSATSVIGGSSSGTGVTFYNVTFSSTSANVKQIVAANTFNNLTITAPAAAGLMECTFSANQTITGTLTCAGATAVRRIFVRSNTLGTTRTLTVNTLSATDCDFRDITIAGTAAGSSPTRAGDCGGNSGITFPSPKTVYWNLAGSQNWSADGWATSSGGVPATNNFPLAQDTATFDNTGSAGTVTIDAAWNIGTFAASARTTAMTLTTSFNTPFVYGNWLFGTGVTSSSTAGTITFAKRGTQTITSNGITFGCPITVTCFAGTVQLADAMSIGSSRLLNLASGTFDAVSYNVTTGYVTTGNAANATVKLGSGTWTISGDGSVFADVWNFASVPVLYKGTANITLSDTSSSARTFAGGGLSYNKLTIGGATGTSTLTITGDNQFTELASTKTVAHTIALGSTTQTFGKWSVTCTSGNVVTLTGTGTSHVLAGAATSAIDYLAMGSIGFAATSPGEFYAGANSTGTATAPVYRTAPPAATTRYWVGGTGTWDASTTTNWSTSSGGAGGASVPTSLDDVIFNTSSSTANAAYTCTIGTGATVRAKKITMGGPGAGNNITWAGSGTMVMHDDFDLTAGTADCTRTFTGAIVLSGSTTGFTFNSNGVTLASAITVNGVSAEWALAGALDIGSSTLTVTNGLFDLATYNLTAGSISSNNGNSRTIDFDTGTTTLSGSTPLTFGTTETNRAALTCTASTSQITCSATSPTFSGNNQTFYNVSFTSTSAGTVTLNGANTFNNLSFTGLTSAGLKEIALAANQTVNGTLTFSAGTNATMRHFCRSDTIGTTRTITTAAFSGTDVDFRDITIAGAAAPVSGTRLGDAKGNSGITFGAGASKYWNLAGGGNWSDTGWATTGGGSVAANNFPLPQDTAVFQSTGLNSGATITVNAAYNIGTIDMSARTANTMTLAMGVAGAFIYGNWINGTGTTLSGVGLTTFSGRGSQTITSAGKTFTQQITVNSPGGSVTLQDAFICSGAGFTLNGGTFDASTYNVTGPFATFGAIPRTVSIGSGTWSIASSGSSWNISSTTNLTITGTGTISLTSASAKTFAGGGLSYSGITLDQAGAGTLTISGNNTFKDITNSYKATGATTISISTTTQTVSQFTAAGESGRVLTVQGSSASSPGTLVLSTTTKPNVDYLTITGVRAYSLDTTWYAGTNSTNNGSLGWYFEAAPSAAATGNFFLIFG